MVDAGRRWRGGRRHPLAWLTYQRRAIDAGSWLPRSARFAAAALAQFWIDDLYEGVIARRCSRSRASVGWVDRYLVDGVLNVVSAWTV